jgi:hypothetical protein
MNFKFFWILSIYTIWDGLSLKTISRYCPFKQMVIYEHCRLSFFLCCIFNSYATGHL